MTDEEAWVPVEQKQVIFNDDEITAVLVQEGSYREVFVSIRQMCERLSVSYQGRMRRINDDPVLSKQVKGVNITFTPIGGRGGGEQATNCLPILNVEQKRVVITTKDSRHGTMPREMLCLPLDDSSGFLFGINADRVRPELRDRVIRY